MHPIARARAHAAERYQKSGAEDTLECPREFFEAVRARQALRGVPPEHRTYLLDATAVVGDNANDKPVQLGTELKVLCGPDGIIRHLEIMEGAERKSKRTRG